MNVNHPLQLLIQSFDHLPVKCHIKWTNPFQFYVFWGGVFYIFYSDFNKTFCKQIMETLIRCSVLLILIYRYYKYGEWVFSADLSYGTERLRLKVLDVRKVRSGKSTNP